MDSITTHQQAISWAYDHIRCRAMAEKDDLVAEIADKLESSEYGKSLIADELAQIVDRPDWAKAREDGDAIEVFRIQERAISASLEYEADDIYGSASEQLGQDRQDDADMAADAAYNARKEMAA